MSEPSSVAASWLKHVPNALTVARLVLVPVFLAMLFTHPADQGWRLATAAVFTVAILTDFFDGRLARRYGLITDFGKLWDPIADKGLTGAALVALSILGELPWWVTILILVREWGITWMRVAMLKYAVMAAAAGGKLKTFLQSIALILFLAYVPSWPVWALVVAWVVMGAAFALTMITGVMYVRDALRLRAAARVRATDGPTAAEATDGADDG